MAECMTCDRGVEHSRECTYCGGVYCGEHVLPESHDCDGVTHLTGNSKPLQGDFHAKKRPRTSRSDRERPKPMDNVRTVGTAPEPEWEKSPDVELKSGEEDADPGKESVVHWIIDRLR